MSSVHISKLQVSLNAGMLSRVKPVIGELDLDVEDGMFLALLGPTGCGKTTLLKTIAGLIRAKKGSIMFDNMDVTHLSPGKRKVGMVFQNYALYPGNPSKFNWMLRFLVKPSESGTGEDMNRRIDETASLLDLDPSLLRKPPGSLSGGEKQKVALGRCVIGKPSVFLMDEPLSDLDAKDRGRLRVELKRLIRRFRTTTIYVTHDQVEAMSMADRVAVMNNGSIEQVDTPGDLYLRPANLFVARFMDPFVNQVNGRIKDGLFFIAGNPVPVPAKGIRNGSAYLCAHAGDLVEDPQGPINGKVILVQPVLPDIRLQVQDDYHTWNVLWRNRKAAGFKGRRFRMSIREGACNYYDRDSGKRL